MSPRKKSKPNSKAEANTETKAQSVSVPQAQELEPELQETTYSSLPQDAEPGESEATGSGKPRNDGTSTPQSSKSWLGGTWPRGNKANPVTQVARESISAAGGTASEAVALARARPSQLPTTPLRNPAVYISRGMGSSSRSLPLAATTTKLNITSNDKSPANGAAKEEQALGNICQPQPEPKPQSERKPGFGAEKSDDAPGQKEPSVKDSADSDSQIQSAIAIKSTNEPTSWLNWFSRAEIAKPDRNTGVKAGSSDETVGATAKNRPQSTIVEAPQESPSSPMQRRNSEPNPVSPKAQEEPPTRSWLSLWGNATTHPMTTSSARATGVATQTSDEPAEPQLESQNVDGPKPDPVSTPRPPLEPADDVKSYGWAFWSRDQARGEKGMKPSESNVGELAQVGAPSQSKPENAVVDEARGVPNKVGKRQRPQPLDAPEDPKKSRGASVDIKKATASDGAAVAVNAKPTVDADSKAKRMPENLLLPAFKRTYQIAGRPGFIQQLSRMLQLSSQSDPKHVDLVRNSPQIKRALAIGVHGYFPAPLIRSVLGQPTGTSIRFANSAASAIQKWTQSQGYSCEVEKVALEGEGRISERVDLLWKLILNWINKIQKADFVMIACHSQGVPVAMMLVAKLIALGCLHSAKIGVCAMAGVNLGPFADYKSRWISGSAGELFDFARSDSQVSKDYEAALDVALRFGVKIVYVGSIDDQLVSLESSTFGTVSHPHIYRAVFVDGRVHAPDFLTHLVGFALKLRNLGISDHGLIRELSTPLAGSLYSGEGHSRIYDDEAVYHLAVEHALETTSIGNMNAHFQRDSLITAQNPYILPFAMRGLLEEDYVRTELYGEITELIKQFDDWKPSSKVLKDVKFRLEGVRSKL